MDIEVIKESSRLSLEGNTPFHEIVQRLGQAGVASYKVDLIRLEKISYGKEKDSYKHLFEFEEIPSIAETFNAEEVIKAIRDIQQQKIEYVSFLRRIMAAGAAHYEVFINGRKAIYTGRHGDFHTEHFPTAK
jgi:uncharacterized protein YbcV (DUF1398 family)